MGYSLKCLKGAYIGDSIKGTAIGVIKGATVCLDCSSNGVC